MNQLGPVLQFLGCHDGQWGISALVVTDAGDAQPVLTLQAPPGSGFAPPAITVVQAAVPGATYTAWRFDFSIVQTGSVQNIWYRLEGSPDAEGEGGQNFDFKVPALGMMPSMAYASCNGFSDPRAMKKIKEANAMWARLNRLHATQDRVGAQTFGPLHVLLLGGDQIYSDSMWVEVPALKAWSELKWDARLAAPFPPGLHATLQVYFAKMYLDRWSQPDVAQTLASVPSVMMWDDHDIMDGWGSYPADLHNCPVYQGIFRVAKAAFELFQRQMMGAIPPATLPGQTVHNSAYNLGDAGLLVLDMRSERGPGSETDANGGTLLRAEQVMSLQSWNAVFDWLSAQEAAGVMKHLFVMSSIPVVHPSFELLEKLLGIFPGQQELEDDLRDHWTSKSHRGERLRLIHRLLQASAKGIRVTLLSGDVHVAALGVIESERTDVPPGARAINQLTSSGIVHPAPPGVALYFLEQACQKIEQIDRDITGTMYEFPTTSHRLIGCRNFLTLQPDGPGGYRYWANWWAEDEPHPYTKVIHSVGKAS